MEKIAHMFFKVLILFSCLAVSVGSWCVVYNARKVDIYPAVVIEESTYFEDAEGDRLYKVRRGDTVYYHKEFCISKKNPRALATKLLSGEISFLSNTGELTARTQFKGGAIRGITRGRFTDGVVVTLPDRDFIVDEGCYKTTNSVRIPESVSTGPNFLQFNFIYQVNLIKNALGIDGPSRFSKKINFEVVD